MPKISTYPLAESISLDDYLLGTQVDNDDDTRNFLLSDIQTLFGGGSGGGGAISITKTALDALVASNGLVPGTYYIISGVDVALYGGTTILIQAATTNTLELAGHGIFYNPKYLNSQTTPNNGYGIWYNYITCTFTNISDPFQNNELITADNEATATYLADGFIQYISGDWSAATSITGNNSGSTADISGAVSPVYNESDTVIWGGKKWINNTGSVGTAIDKYTLSSDWTVVAFNSTDYNVVADVIHYDYEHDMIIRRKDKWNNDVDGSYLVFTSFGPDDYDYGNPIKDFQWGNGPEDLSIDFQWIGVFSNYVKDSYLECLNFVGRTLNNNIINQFSYIPNNITDKTAVIDFNNVFNDSYIQDNIIYNNASFSGNKLEIGSSIFENKIYNGDISENILSQGSQIQANILYQSNIARNNLNRYSNINSNELFQGSFIVSNNLIVSSGISDNTLTNNCQISDNSSELSSNIFYNYLNSNSQIESNNLNTYGGIIDNTITNSSNSNRNNISNYSQINNNIIDTNCHIDSNILNLSYIRRNTLNSTSYIYHNILNESDMADCTINTQDIGHNTLNDSQIYYCNLSLGGNITYNTLNYSQLNLGSTDILETTLQNIVFNQSLVNEDLSSSTIIYGEYSKQIFKNSSLVVRLGYYNASDVFTVVNVNA